MNVIYGIAYVLAAYRWGKWKDWKKYYSTILFFIIGDLLYQYLLSDLYPMWKYVPIGPDAEKGMTHTHIVLLIMLIKYPCTILIYIGNYPYKKRIIYQIVYIGLWTLLFTVNELITKEMGGMTHHNGWDITASIIFNIAMFTILTIHYKKPLIAWGLSFIFIVILWNYFHVPGEVFR